MGHGLSLERLEHLDVTSVHNTVAAVWGLELEMVQLDGVSDGLGVLRVPISISIPVQKLLKFSNCQHSNCNPLRLDQNVGFVWSRLSHGESLRLKAWQAAQETTRKTSQVFSLSAKCPPTY